MSDARDTDALQQPAVVELPTPEWARGLTLKQRRFIEAYMGEAQGNGTFAAKLAGYSGNNVTLGAMACETLKNPRVKRAIAQMTESDPLIATRAQRQAFWTEVMQSPESEMKDRLKASELLGKTQADFVERREVVSDVAVEHEHRHKHTVDLSQLTDEELRVLEKVIGKVGES